MGLGFPGSPIHHAGHVEVGPIRVPSLDELNGFRGRLSAREPNRYTSFLPRHAIAPEFDDSFDARTGILPKFIGSKGTLAFTRTDNPIRAGQRLKLLPARGVSTYPPDAGDAWPLLPKA